MPIWIICWLFSLNASSVTNESICCLKSRMFCQNVCKKKCNAQEALKADNSVFTIICGYNTHTISSKFMLNPWRKSFFCASKNLK
jgi:hypothetical protein